MKNIVFDCFQYSEKVTGTDRQAKNFIDELQKIDKTNTYKILCSEYDFIPSGIYSESFKVIRINKKLTSFHPFLSRIYKKIWREAQILKLKLFSRNDIYLSFHNMQLPRFRVASKMMLFNLDIIPLALKEYENVTRYSAAELKKIYQRNVNRSDEIISISNFSKNELLKHFDAKHKKISVVHLGATPMSRPDSLSNINDFTIPDTFLLSIGGAEVRKNVGIAMDAHKNLPNDMRKKFPLIVVGGDWQGISLREQEYVYNIGYVSDEELAYLYNKCHLFIFPSVYEGFGLPVIEAIEQGAPVLCAKGSSLDEICTDVILQFDPMDEAELRHLVYSLLKSPKKYSSYLKRFENLKGSFSWQKSAKKLLECF